MPVKFVDTGSVLTLGAGKSKKLKWNNAAPAEAVWSVNAVPLPQNAKSSHSGSVEITRMWRKINVAVPSTGAPKVEHEIHYEVKNPGTSSVKFTIYLLVAW
jgi:hypothetical protein